MNAHDREYAAAVAGMAETYGTRTPRTYADGDFISGITAGKRWQGHIEWIDGDRVTVKVGGSLQAYSIKDITH
jgi:hypothetical protein